MIRAPTPLLLLALAACGPDTLDTAEGDPACDPASDPDGDGLDDCLEAELGTDPALADSDGDGLSDSAELDCVSDPLDSGEVCYACGWGHNDPGTLASTGAGEGDVIANVPLMDPCGESVPLWDFAGGWRLLSVTAAWCTACYAEVQEYPERQAAFRSSSGLDFEYLLVLYEDALRGEADDEVAGEYAEAVGLAGEVPVLSDPGRALPESMPWSDALPGKCVLSPQMEMVHCYVSAEDDEAFEIIRELSGG